MSLHIYQKSVSHIVLVDPVHYSKCLSLYQYHSLFITVALYYVLKSILKVKSFKIGHSTFFAFPDIF